MCCECAARPRSGGVLVDGQGVHVGNGIKGGESLRADSGVDGGEHTGVEFGEGGNRSAPWTYRSRVGVRQPESRENSETADGQEN